jgi:UDP-N-acetylmuramoyl-L-alanyl-D-glutamate--2,6-diaminopimelate ligase
MEAIMRHGTHPINTGIAGAGSPTEDHANHPAIAASDSQISSGQVDPSCGETDAARSLRDLLPVSRFLTTDDLHFRSVAGSADQAEPGDLVVYRIGRDCPSQLVADAMARGAAGILTEQVLPCPLPQCIVGDIELALARIKVNEHNRPDRSLLNIAVVGSAGKTSTTLLIASLLRGSGIRTAFQSDLGSSDGVVQSTPTQPLACGSALIDWLAGAVDCQCQASIIEIAEDKARHGHYDAIEFDMVVVTGSSSCAGDFGPSGLQCVLERLTPQGVVIAPVDDTRSMRVIRDTGSKLVTYGIRKAADISAKIIDQSGGMTTLLVTHDDTTVAMETPLCGSAMAANHAAAALVGLLLDQPLHEIAEKLGQLRSLPGRGQRLEAFGHATVILETGGSADRVRTALRTHRSMKSGGRLWCVMAVDEQTGTENLAEIGSSMERFSDVAIVTSTTVHKERFLATSHHVLDGVQKVAAFRLVADRGRSLQWALSEADSRDTIVVFTNERYPSAHQQRADLEKLSRSVEQFRSEQQANGKVGADAPIRLSIFG